MSVKFAKIQPTLFSINYHNKSLANLDKMWHPCFMDKKQAKALKRKINGKKPLNIKKWVFKVLPVISFAVISITIISLLLYVGGIATHEFSVDLGGGRRVDEVFAIEPPMQEQLPPIHELPPLYTPTYTPQPPTYTPIPPYCDYCYCHYGYCYGYCLDCQNNCNHTYTPPCNLPPIPIYLECGITYTTTNTFNSNQLSFVFDTTDRTVFVSLFTGGVIYTANTSFEVIGTNHILVNLELLDELFTLNITLQAGTLSIICSTFIAATGFFNPFNFVLTLFIDWTM